MKEPIDIVGMKSGLLTVECVTDRSTIYGRYWKCKCKCGNYCFKITSDIISGKAKSCGCLRKKHIQDIIGRKVGKLTVMEDTGKSDKSRRKLWKCQCDCGNEIEVPTSSIVYCRSMSCGRCEGPKDIVGERFGKLVILRRAENDKRQKSMWVAACDCNIEKEFLVSRRQLFIIGKKSCGCDKPNYSFKDMPSCVYERLLFNARVRDIEIAVSSEDIYNLFLKQNGICALSGMPIILGQTDQEFRKGIPTASLDRIDSEKGYCVDNIQWVHKQVNFIKQDLKNEELIGWATKIYFNQFKNKPTWDVYFINLAKLISIRSIDPSTKHGCVIVDEDNHIISTGYNGPVQNINDLVVPLERPKKYYWMSHSEQNAIMFCKSDMKRSTVYVTGRPCCFCTRMLIQKKVARIVYGAVESRCVDEADRSEADAMLAQTKIIVDKINL